MEWKSIKFRVIGSIFIDISLNRGNYRSNCAGVLYVPLFHSNVIPQPTATVLTSDIRNDDKATEAVVSAVADAEGVSPLELRPLASVIDPDALNTLLRGNRGDRTIEFTYHGYRVRISGGGDVTLSERDR